MNISNLTYRNNDVYSKINNETINSLNTKTSTSSTNAYSQNYKDSISISSRTNKIGSLGLDKGTASNTTLYVDRKTFDSIVSYSANNESCKWDEMGIDGEKRWVVINGQRFECPLSEAEKEAARRASMTIVDYFAEAEKEKQEEESKKENQEKVTISSISNSNLNTSNSKIKNLLNNEPVMNMLKDIASKNGGAINLFA